MNRDFAERPGPPGPSPIEQVLDEVASSVEVRAVVDALSPNSAQAVHGVGGSAKTLLAAATHRERTLPSLYVCGDMEAARRLETDFITWLGEDAVALFPPREFSPLGVVA